MKRVLKTLTRGHKPYQSYLPVPAQLNIPAAKPYTPVPATPYTPVQAQSNHTSDDDDEDDF